MREHVIHIVGEARDRAKIGLANALLEASEHHANERRDAWDITYEEKVNKARDEVDRLEKCLLWVEMVEFPNAD